MKILFLTHRLPYPPNRGGRIRPYQVLRHLSRDHQVTLAALVRADDQAADVAQLRSLTARQLLVPVNESWSWLRVATALPTRIPSSFAYYRSARLADLVRRELRRSYDLVYVHCSSMGPYVGAVEAATVLDLGDIDSEKWRAYGRHRPFPSSLGFSIEARKVRRAEAALAARFDLCTCTTPEELADLPTARRTGWFRNGVDAQYFCPSADPYDPDTICFLGRMDYYPNREAMVWFCDTVLPLLRARHPGVQLSIIGADPSREIRRLGQRPGVHVTGPVSDVRPHARRAALSLAPLRIGRGTQNKVLESLAMGIPVVASPLAARGTDTVAGQHLLVASQPHEIAAAVLRLLRDPQERQRLARAGRQRMLTHHGWDASMRRLDALIDACLIERRTR